MPQWLHQLLWSLQRGRLHEIFLKDSITLATWGLVLVTLLLVLDGWGRGREQRKRWDRDDELRTKDRDEQRERWRRDDAIRSDQSKYRYRMWITQEDAGVSISIANLGYTSFLVGTVFLYRKSAEGEVYPPSVLPWRKVIAPSGLDTFVIESELFTQCSSTYLKCDVSLSLDGVDGRVPTDMTDFDVLYEEGKLTLI